MEMPATYTAYCFMDRVSEQQEWNMCSHTQLAARSSLRIIYQTITEVRVSFTIPTTLPPGKDPPLPIEWRVMWA